VKALNLVFHPGWSVAAAYAVANLVAFALYAVDKSAARRGRPRVRERTLHGAVLIGGFLGALAGRTLFAHKTQRTSFLLVPLLAASVHGAAWWLAFR
jgi:uncharacterized membrane protein YsdA (DUF1294 family)